MSVVIAIDAGTTGVRSRAIFTDGRASVSSYVEFPQYFPQPGWVEHDALEILFAVRQTLSDVIAQLAALPDANIVTIGITNQRETIVAWDK